MSRADETFAQLLSELRAAAFHCDAYSIDQISALAGRAAAAHRGAIESALAERDAGEAARTKAAVDAALATERAAMLAHVESEAKCYREHGLDGAESALGIVANWLRACATSPAPEASTERGAVERLAALLDEAVVALTDASETIDEADELMMRERLLDDEDVDVSQAVSARCLALGNRITEALAAARAKGPPRG